MRDIRLAIALDAVTRRDEIDVMVVEGRKPCPADLTLIRLVLGTQMHVGSAVRKRIEELGSQKSNRTVRRAGQAALDEIRVGSSVYEELGLGSASRRSGMSHG